MTADVYQKRRAALYYPHLHIRDENWLKAAILCFGQVRELRPRDYRVPKDPRRQAFIAKVQRFRELEGASGEALLGTEVFDPMARTNEVARAQERMLRRLEPHRDWLVERFSRRRVEADGEPVDYVHSEKLGGQLWTFLEAQRLAWHAEDDYDTTLLHARLAEAIMAVTAIAIARSKALDIVTTEPHAHHALATQDENELFDTLLNTGVAQKSVTASEAADELATVVVSTKFDVARLTPEQVAELVRNGLGLDRFKNAILPIAASIADATDPATRERAFRDAAERVIAEWQSYQTSLPRFALDAIFEAQNFRMPQYLGALATFAPLVAAGITVAVAAWKGTKIVRDFRKESKNPFGYLTAIEKRAPLIAGSPKPLTTS